MLMNALKCRLIASKWPLLTTCTTIALALLTGLGLALRNAVSQEGAKSGREVSAAPGPLFQHPTKRPSFEEVEKVAGSLRVPENFSTDLAEMAKASSGMLEKSVAEFRPLVWVLGYQGSSRSSESSESVRALEALLKVDYHERKLPPEAERTLMDAILALGFAAARNENASELVRSGTEPEFWKKVRKWRSDRSDAAKTDRGDFSNDVFVRYSIQAVGISGRADSRSFLEGLRSKKSARYLHLFAGDIVQAEFYAYLRNDRKGPNDSSSRLWKYVLSPDEENTEFAKWVAREGHEQVVWANRTMRGPLPTGRE
jgi:hypothetical protein